MIPPRRILVLGGGMVGLAAAHFLTRTPALQRRHSVRVVQRGWRLGGQAASGRGAHGRIEEHGLHLLLGCYENAFAMLREVYASLDRPAGCPIRTWEQAFAPLDVVTMHERVAGRSLPWCLRFPRNRRTPGDGGLWLTPRDHLDALLRARRGLLSGARDDARTHDVATLARRGATLLDLVSTCARGMVRDRVDTRGFDALDDEDLRAWLLRHGARRDTARSALLKTAYDLCFASEQGPAANSGFAAGVALRFFLRAFLGYKRAIGWPMNAGTGDALVAPLYELLRRRGVTFSFFQRVRSLDLCPAARAPVRHAGDAGAPHRRL